MHPPIHNPCTDPCTAQLAHHPRPQSRPHPTCSHRLHMILLLYFILRPLTCTYSNPVTFLFKRALKIATTINRIYRGHLLFIKCTLRLEGCIFIVSLIPFKVFSLCKYQFLVHKFNAGTSRGGLGHQCYIFQPAFGCCTPQTLVKIFIFSIFCAKKLKKCQKSKLLKNLAKK